jgi:predicted kinase
VNAGVGRRGPLLILLNGVPGVGKSTLGRLFADRHPMTFCCDVDVLRAMLGAWEEDRSEAGRLARRFAIAGMRAHLGGGHSVIVPQYLGRIEWVLELEGLARETGIPLVEIVLVAGGDDAVRRFQERSQTPQRPEHAVALAGLGGGDPEVELRAMAGRLAEVVAARTRTIEVVSTEGAIEASYRALSRAVDRA